MIPNLFILYVKDPIVSQVFYEKLFECEAATALPTYVDFTFENGISLALWSIHADSFVSGGTGHKSEFCFMYSEESEVHDTYQKWKNMGVEIEQKPMEAAFGLTFVALDPDGHRIRVCLDN